MIKDIVLALEVGSARDAARDYAISIAAAFNGHIAAIGFAYEPTMPPADTVSAVPFDILDAERETNRKAASDAIARFEEAARLAAVSAESRLVEASILSHPRAKWLNSGTSTSGDPGRYQCLERTDQARARSACAQLVDWPR